MTTELTILPAPVLPPAAAGAPLIADELVVDGGKFGHYNLAHIRISRTNRKRFNEPKLKELAASIKAKGVAQPILIRPVTPTEAEPQLFEIVAGERRFRASIIAGLTSIPAMCRELSDLEALELQILENLQRDDPHPLEEAEGYERLMLTYGYNADQLAEKVNKSRSYVYGRLKLCALSLDVREQFLDDKIAASTALLIARIPVPALQAKALAEILAPTGYPVPEPMSYRRAVTHIQNRYMLALDDAPFALHDGKLLGSAGACTTCPKRTGNDKVLFADVAENICTDPDCFAEKRAANDAKKIVIANKKGIPVIEGAAATATLGNLTTVFGDGNLWKLDRLAPGQTNNSIINTVLTEAQLPQPKALVRLDNGKVRTLYSKAEVQIAAEKAGICESMETYNARIEADQSTPEAIAKAKKQDESRQKHMAQLERAEALTRQRTDLLKRVRNALSATFMPETLRELAKRMAGDYSLPKGFASDFYSIEDDSVEGLCAHIDQAPAQEVRRIILDLVLAETLKVNHWDLDKNGDLNPDDNDGYQALLRIAKHEGIDLADQAEQAESSSKPALEQPVPRAKIQLKPKTTVAAAGTADAGPVIKIKKHRTVELSPAAAWPFPRPENDAKESEEAPQ